MVNKYTSFQKNSIINFCIDSVYLVEHHYLIYRSGVYIFLSSWNSWNMKLRKQFCIWDLSKLVLTHQGNKKGLGNIRNGDTAPLVSISQLHLQFWDSNFRMLLFYPRKVPLACFNESKVLGSTASSLLN